MEMAETDAAWLSAGKKLAINEKNVFFSMQKQKLQKQIFFG